MIAIVGGAKVSTKLTVLRRCSARSTSSWSAAASPTPLAATGRPVGRSLYEPDMIDIARRLSNWRVAAWRFRSRPTSSATELSASATATKPASEVADDEMIRPAESAARIAAAVAAARTVLWNARLVCSSTSSAVHARVATAIARSGAFSIAGGGDTLAAIDRYGIGADVSYVSTGGGAFLRFVEAGLLPAVAILEQRALG